MSVLTQRNGELLEAVQRVATDVAAVHADDVDQRARFPHETIEALREVRALGAFVPPELGGSGADLPTIATCCFELGRRCGASAMVFAMHQIQVGTIVRHLDAAPWFEQYLQELTTTQRLIASVTSEVGTGGDIGRSIAPLTPNEDGGFEFVKNAPTVSYGRHADDLLVTLRSSPSAEQNDQVAVLVRGADAVLEPTGSWDVLGMRGTCSPGFMVRARVSSAQILPTPFARAARESMVPLSHLLWSHLWLGIASDAFDRARAFVRAAAKRTPGQTPPAAARLSDAHGKLTLLRAETEACLREFLLMSEEPERPRLGTLSATLRFNNLKVTAADQVVDICRDALDICGIAGFKNDTPYSIARHLRDALSAPLMIANERIRQTNGSLLLVTKEA